MSDYDDVVEILPPSTSNGDEPEHDEPEHDSTLLGLLKQQRASVARRHTTDVVVPGWRGLLGLRLGAISGAAQARLFERVQKNPAIANVDTIIAAFQAVLGRAREGDPWQVLVDPEDGQPMQLDYLLAEQLGIEGVSTAREVTVALFLNANSPGLAMAAMAAEFLEWARESGGEVDEEYLGES